MKILLIGPYFGNALHGCEVGIYDALIELGHKVQVLDYRVNKFIDEYGNSCTIDIETFLPGNAELILCPGAGLPERVLTRIRDSIGIRILWNSEPLRLQGYRDRVLGQRGEYDVTFTFDESEIPIYKQGGIEAKFLPQAFNPKWYHPLDPKEPDFLGSLPGEMCFVGSIGGKWSNREVFLDRLAREHSVTIATTFDARVVNRIYNRSKLVLNLGLYCPESGPPEDLRAFGLQQRIFEAIGAGRVCVTNAIPRGTNELFVDRKHVLYYTSADLEDVIDYGLNENNRMAIEQQVLAIRDDHTYTARMHQMFEMLR